MYIKLQRKDLPSSVFVSKFYIAFDSRNFAFLTPAHTSTLVATPKICIELLDYRTGPDPLLLLGKGSGPLGTYSGEGVLVY